MEMERKNITEKVQGIEKGKTGKNIECKKKKKFNFLQILND